MNRIAFAALAALAVSLPAQEQKPPPEQKPPAIDTEPVQRPLTEDEKKQNLLEQMRKLQEELEFLNRTQVVGGVIGRVADRLKERAMAPQQVDDPGTPAGGNQATTTPPPSPVGEGNPGAGTQPARKARLLGDAEKLALKPGTILTVDGLAVSEDDFQTVYGYLKSVPGSKTDDELRTQTLEVLINRRAVEAAFPDGAKAARDRMVKAQQQLKSGTDFAKVAEQLSDCPSKTQGGDLNWFPRSMMDTHFTIAVFGLKDGEVSEPVQTAFGYHIIKRTGFKKGDSPDQDQIRASHILAMYGDDQYKVRQAGDRVRQGQVDVAFVSDDYRKFVPDYLK